MHHVIPEEKDSFNDLEASILVKISVVTKKMIASGFEESNGVQLMDFTLQEQNLQSDEEEIKESCSTKGIKTFAKGCHPVAKQRHLTCGQ